MTINHNQRRREIELARVNDQLGKPFSRPGTLRKLFTEENKERFRIATRHFIKKSAIPGVRLADRIMTGVRVLQTNSR